MRLGVVVALWGREDLARLSLTRYMRAARGLDMALVAVTDEERNGAMARALGYDVVEAPNFPVSNKHNAGARRLRDHNVDAIVVLGSDDWVCDRFFANWMAELEHVPVVGISDDYLVCTYQAAACHWTGYTNHRIGESIGVGRALRRDVLDRLDWLPWESGKDKGLDATMTGRLKAIGYSTAGRAQADLGVRVVGFKSGAELTAYERLSRHGTRQVPREEALAPFPRDERDALARLCTYPVRKKGHH